MRSASPSVIDRSFNGARGISALARWASRLLPVLLLALAALGMVSPARAQCEAAPLPTPVLDAIPIFQLQAGTVWDPDGPGPRSSALLVSYFSWPRLFDLATLAEVPGAPLAAGGGHIRVMRTAPSGELFAAGDFTFLDGGQGQGSLVTAEGLARFDGTRWQGIVPGVDTTIRDLLFLPGGEMIVGGDFASAGGQPIRAVARFNGTTWSALGAGISAGTVWALASHPSGDLIVGGRFTLAGSSQVCLVARWNGSVWTPLGTSPGGVALSPSTRLVTALAVGHDGSIYAGGDFTSISGIPAARVARWNGSAWSALGAGIGGTASSLPSSFYSDRSAPIVTTLHVSDQTLVVGGSFTLAGAAPASHLAVWDGSVWTAPVSLGWTPPAGAPEPALVDEFVVLPGGTLGICGVFNTANGQPVSGFARFRPRLAPPQITLQPQGTAACVGGAASISLDIAPSPGAMFAWRRSGVPIDPTLNPSAATGTLLLAGLRSHEARSYDCVVSNSCGSVTSQPATLWFREPPRVVVPADRCLDSQIVLSVAPGEVGPTSYLWRRNGIALSDGGRLAGATTATLSIAAATLGDQGVYDCLVGSVCGQIATEPVDLTIGPLVTPPADAFACVGTTATLTVSAPSGAQIQWYRVAGSYQPLWTSGNTSALTSTLVLPNVDPSLGGEYICRVLQPGSVCATQDYRVRLTVGTGVPTVSVPVGAVRVCSAVSSAQLRVSAAGPGGSGTVGLSYQWRKAGVPIQTTQNPTATLPTLTIPIVSDADVGTYDCVVSNSCGDVTSSPVTLSRCFSDMNCSGTLNIDDIFIYLNLWFSGCS